MARTKEAIDAAFKLVESLAGKEGGLDDSVYRKCTICLAHEYSLINDMDMVQYLIAKVPKEYYENVQLRQMAEDETYREVVILLAYTLIQRGLVAGSDDIWQPTQSAARA